MPSPRSIFFDRLFCDQLVPILPITGVIEPGIPEKIEAQGKIKYIHVKELKWLSGHSIGISFGEILIKVII